VNSNWVIAAAAAAEGVIMNKDATVTCYMKMVELN